MSKEQFAEVFSNIASRDITLAYNNFNDANELRELIFKLRELLNSCNINNKEDLERFFKQPMYDGLSVLGCINRSIGEKTEESDPFYKTNFFVSLCYCAFDSNLSDFYNKLFEYACYSYSIDKQNQVKKDLFIDSFINVKRNTYFNSDIKYYADKFKIDEFNELNEIYNKTDNFLKLKLEINVDKEVSVINDFFGNIDYDFLSEFLERKCLSDSKALCVYSALSCFLNKGSAVDYYDSCLTYYCDLYEKDGKVDENKLRECIELCSNNGSKQFESICSRYDFAKRILNSTVKKSNLFISDSLNKKSSEDNFDVKKASKVNVEVKRRKLNRKEFFDLTWSFKGKDDEKFFKYSVYYYKKLYDNALKKKDSSKVKIYKECYEYYLQKLINYRSSKMNNSVSFEKEVVDENDDFKEENTFIKRNMEISNENVVDENDDFKEENTFIKRNIDSGEEKKSSLKGDLISDKDELVDRTESLNNQGKELLDTVNTVQDKKRLELERINKTYPFWRKQVEFFDGVNEKDFNAQRNEAWRTIQKYKDTDRQQYLRDMYDYYVLCYSYYKRNLPEKVNLINSFEDSYNMILKDLKDLNKEENSILNFNDNWDEIQKLKDKSINRYLLALKNYYMRARSFSSVKYPENVKLKKDLDHIINFIEYNFHQLKLGNNVDLRPLKRFDVNKAKVVNDVSDNSELIINDSLESRKIMSDVIDEVVSEKNNDVYEQIMSDAINEVVSERNSNNVYEQLMLDSIGEVVSKGRTK
jgi:hypothetical protein